MRKYAVLMAALVCLGILAAAGECQAVIYKYMNENGEPVYVDDLTKVPDTERGNAVIVTGQAEQELMDDEERARALAARDGVPLEQIAGGAPKTGSFAKRLIRSGAAVTVVVAVLFVIVNIDALRERKKLVKNTRLALLAVLLLFLGFTHARDVIGLFGSAGVPDLSPVAGIKERQAARGKQAAEAYKSMERMMGQQAQEEADRIQKQFDEAERGQ